MDERAKRIEPMCITSEKSEQIICADEIRRVKTNVGRRIVEAFGYQPDAEIAFLLKASRTEVESFTKGAGLPPAETLLSIHRATGVSIHWLLTGEGAKRAQYQVVFAAHEEPAIYGLA